MPAKRDQWLRRIKAVDREHAATAFAIDRLLPEVRHDSTILTADLRVRDVQLAADRLVATYVIRLVAEFEAGLREFWATLRDTHPPLRDLLISISAIRRIPDTVSDEAHAVRVYRNSLVHERNDDALPIAIALAQEHLCRYFSRLPMRW